MGTRAVPLPFQFEIILGKGTSPVPRNLIDLPSPCRLILGFDCADRDQWPPEARFIEAAHHGDVRDIKKIAKELDVHGHGILATVASTTYMGMNALHAAGGFGKLPVYQYLVEEVGMEVNKPDTAQGNSFIHILHPWSMPLTMATFLPSVTFLTMALICISNASVTLLRSAAVRGYSEIVKFLISRGADVDSLSVTGTPLSLAALKGHASTIKILLQHNADVLFKFFLDLLALNFNSLFC
ncbi:ankyrin repeat and SOCS box protein 7-like isoform X1 [Hordeum vulgare subsp. vulgare]|uniref:ankyrin repeat and SOCS box protein 7-like isoform X1 n=1 Tax=Hordeum vulgare subsp. vulgare TaxID=112509 RepID=UPI001D1A51F4|nr:ankyrin repeat and SOCS box protein 7-like isoform X1 [Hordeum vulgare subsp. vulgare]